jgi:hypothetical protein
MTDGLLLPPGGGRRIQTMTLKAGAEQSKIWSAFEADVAPGFDVGAHLHHQAEEVFYVLEGELDLLAFQPAATASGDWRTWESATGTTVFRGGPGSFMFVPVGSGPGRPALPLVLTHGWPSSFLEMLPLAALLTDPAGHDGDPDDAFDVVIPSLPGFAFSGLPLTGPVTPPVIADLWARLMSDVLGYSRFGAYGGDIGSHVTGFLGARHRDGVLGHLHPPAQPASGAGRHPAVVDHRAGLPRRPASRTRQRRRLRRDPEHPARHPRCCADRLPVRAGRLAGGEIPGVERLRRQP